MPPSITQPRRPSFHDLAHPERFRRLHCGHLSGAHPARAESPRELEKLLCLGQIADPLIKCTHLFDSPRWTRVPYMSSRRRPSALALSSAAATTTNNCTFFALASLRRLSRRKENPRLLWDSLHRPRSRNRKEAARMQGRHASEVKPHARTHVFFAFLSFFPHGSPGRPRLSRGPNQEVFSSLGGGSWGLSPFGTPGGLV